MLTLLINFGANTVFTTGYRYLSGGGIFSYVVLRYSCSINIFLHNLHGYKRGLRRRTCNSLWVSEEYFTCIYWTRKYRSSIYQFNNYYHAVDIGAPARRIRSASTILSNLYSTSSITKVDTGYCMRRNFKCSLIFTKDSAAASNMISYNQLGHLRFILYRLVGHWPEEVP